MGKRKRKKGDRKKAEKLTKAIGVPSSVFLDLPCIRCEGRKYFLCDNHKGVIEYSVGCLRFRTLDGITSVRGKELLLRDFANDCIAIEGKIDSIEFE